MRLISRVLALCTTVFIFAGCQTTNHPPAAVPVSVSTPTGSGLGVPNVFSEHMVLQQGAAVPVWGWGDEGATVTVRFRDQTVSTQVKNGQWMVRLQNLKAGGPDALTITSGTAIVFKDVLVGEVWLAGGQSNMEFPLRMSFEAEQDIAEAANPMIRLLKVRHVRLESPTNNIAAHWMECDPHSSSNFSAVAYYFARDLQKRLNVPIGIIESDWGGTPAESWMERGFLDADPSYHDELFGAWIVAEDHYQHRLAAYNKERDDSRLSNTIFTKPEPQRPWKPAELYNGMIAPLAPYGIKGALWYQGESNANGPDQAWLYHRLFPDLIRDWRKVWGEGDFPFLLVQLAPYMKMERQPGESSWASLREAQLGATKLPNVGMAVITDVGEQSNIHPTKKKPVGERLARAARGIAYHEPIEYSGPIYQKMNIEGDDIVLTFTHTGGGLIARNGEKLSGFAICGRDHKFFWADAEIQSPTTVVVHSPQVPRPVAVRYGWANFPVVNLWNQEDLPASPFRTDDFELK